MQSDPEHRPLDPRSALFGVALVLVPWTFLSGGSGASAIEPLDDFSLVEMLDGQGGTVTTLRLSGVNLQVVNGSGSTESSDGLGNVIVGYNESEGPRVGSHNLIVGRGEYRSYGGVAASQGRLGAPYSSVFGGWGEAEGAASTTCGGLGATVTAESALCFGGIGCRLERDRSVALGGDVSLIFDGDSSAVVGGWKNETFGQWCVVLGGVFNRAVGTAALIVGGDWNLTLAGSEYASAVASDSALLSNNNVLLGAFDSGFLTSNSTVGCGTSQQRTEESLRWYGGNCEECDRAR